MPTKSPSKRSSITQAARTVAAPAKAGQATKRKSGALSVGTPAPQEVTDALASMIDDYHAEEDRKNQGADAPRSPGAKEGGTGVKHALRFVELDSINLGDNPRTEFDQGSLRELAESIKEVGLLQALVVADCDGELELIDGGRRWRACKLAGLTVARCDVRPMSRDEITLARLAANLQREDLTCLDEANGYSDALRLLEITQEELAKRLGISQGQISNRLRLLKLPLEWRRKIISGEITATQARDLVPWAEFPGVLAEIDGALEDLDEDDATDQNGDKIETLAELSPAAWHQVLTDAIWEVSENLHGQRQIKAGWGCYDLRKVDDATRERLQILKIKSRYGGWSERCFNKELWDKLTAQQAGDYLARERKGQAKQEKRFQAVEKRPPTKEELAERALHHNKRLYRHKIQCLQKMISTKADKLTDEHLMQFLLSVALINGSPVQREQQLRDACKTAGVKMPSSGDGWEKAAPIGSSKSRGILIGWIKNWCKLDARSAGDTHPRWYEHVAEQLKIDFAAEWRVSSAFLELHTIEQLGELAKEWKISPPGGSKAATVTRFIADDQKRRLPCPKELITCKSCGLD